MANARFDLGNRRSIRLSYGTGLILHSNFFRDKVFAPLLLHPPTPFSKPVRWSATNVLIRRIGAAGHKWLLTAGSNGATTLTVELEAVSGTRLVMRPDLLEAQASIAWALSQLPDLDVMAKKTSIRGTHGRRTHAAHKRASAL
jgi:hypothetical protein